MKGGVDRGENPNEKGRGGLKKLNGEKNRCQGYQSEARGRSGGEKVKTKIAGKKKKTNQWCHERHGGGRSTGPHGGEPKILPLPSEVGRTRQRLVRDQKIMELSKNQWGENIVGKERGCRRVHSGPKSYVQVWGGKAGEFPQNNLRKKGKGKKVS